jgi:hypothetical protein
MRHFASSTSVPKITIRDAKGYKHHVTMLPHKLIPALQQQLTIAKRIHQQDLT